MRITADGAILPPVGKIAAMANGVILAEVGKIAADGAILPPVGRIVAAGVIPVVANKLYHSQRPIEFELHSVGL